LSTRLATGIQQGLPQAAKLFVRKEISNDHEAVPLELFAQTCNPARLSCRDPRIGLSANDFAPVKIATN
jgi:hypothetical protein